MPKGRFPKLKGSICNILIHVNEITNILLHCADSNGPVIVKLKIKLSFRSNVYFEAVCRESFNQALLYLKKYNPLYQNVTINMNNTPDNLKDLTDSTTDIFMFLLIWRKMLTLNLTISLVHRRVFSFPILHQLKK